MENTTQANTQAVAQLTAPGAPFEVIETYYDGIPLKTYKNAAATLIEFMAPGRAFGDALLCSTPIKHSPSTTFGKRPMPSPPI